MFANQRDNCVVGDMAGNDINKTFITNNYSGGSPLAHLYERLRQDEGGNQLAVEMYGKLQHFCSVSTDGDVRGLEEKLSASERKDLIRRAERLKEQAAKLIMKWQTSGTAQEILAMILSKLYTAFTLNVTPAVEKGEPREVVDQLIYKEVIQATEAILGENALTLYDDDILGLLFFLGGNCHIRWDKC